MEPCRREVQESGAGRTRIGGTCRAFLRLSEQPDSQETGSGRNVRKLAIHSAMRILRGQLADPQPEERLWLAVIEHAVRDAYSPTTKSEEVREEARMWLDSEEFSGVVTALGLNPQWARQKIQQISEIEGHL